MQQDGASTDRIVRSSRGKWILLTALSLAVVGLLTGVYLYPSFNRWVSADRSIDRERLRLGQVTRGDLMRDVSVQGRIVAADHPTLLSSAQGVVSLLVKAGDVVSQGSVLARIESPELQNKLAQELSSVESAKSERDRMQIFNSQTDLENRQAVSLLEVKLRAAERSLSRAKELFEAGLASSIDHQKAKDDVEVAELELAHARQKADLARETMDFELQTQVLEIERQSLVIKDLERKISELSILSPVNGLVSRVDIRDKDMVQANQSLMSVVDLSEFEIEIQVPENYADEIGIDTEASIRYERREYNGRVKSLSPEVEDSQVKGIVGFTGESPSGLKQNQRVNCRLILTAHPDVLKIPRGPFLESLGGRQVYRVREGVAELVNIQVGALSVTEIEILSGLELGDEIVLSDLTRFNGVQRILLRN
ncbi:MAG: efflux RND transporter periplasmic adaptor subunit [Acidobacteriota bacterium]|nr:MAG: efflux RND transporter periplasmic adaptor subunit [Acidobacteriota bacterium]